jgi:hypothetical protein
MIYNCCNFMSFIRGLYEVVALKERVLFRFSTIADRHSRGPREVRRHSVCDYAGLVLQRI